METSTYVSVSGQLALERRLATIAQNIANANTAGYRATNVHFETVMSNTSQVPTAFADAGAEHVLTGSGGLTQTSNPLDMAIQGEGFFALQSAQGIYYSRDGRFQISEDGQLRSLNGDPVLDQGGAPLELDPAGGPPVVAKDGGVFQAGTRQGTIGLFEIDTRQGYSRHEGSGIIPVAAATTLEPGPGNGIVQGFVEGANVNPINEMVKLIQVTRAFESVSTMMEKSQDAVRSAIQTLGGR
jgi:flagellar basal-body rod protein FlgF